MNIPYSNIKSSNTLVNCYFLNWLDVAGMDSVQVTVKTLAPASSGACTRRSSKESVT